MGQQELCSLPQAEPERAKGPNLAAEKHGSTEEERRRGKQGLQVLQEEQGGSKALTQGPRVSLPSVQPAAPFIAWPDWQGRCPLPHGTEMAEAAGFS